MHANDSNRVNIHEARSRELTTSAYCDAVFCLTLQTKSKYEKQIIGRRKKREWTSVNSQTIRRIKQNNEVHCLHRQLCICAQYVQFVGIFIRNNAQSYCKHPLKLGESIFLRHLFTFTPDCNFGSLFIFSSFIWKSLSKLNDQIFSENCIFSQWIGWSSSKHDSQITWIVKQLVKCSQMSHMNIFHIKIRQIVWMRDAEIMRVAFNDIKDIQWLFSCYSIEISRINTVEVRVFIAIILQVHDFKDFIA